MELRSEMFRQAPVRAKGFGALPIEDRSRPFQVLEV